MLVMLMAGLVAETRSRRRDFYKYGGDDMMPDSLLCEQRVGGEEKKKKKRKKKLVRILESERKDGARWGEGGVLVGAPTLERKGEKDDGLIYSEWENQTLMAFLSLSFSLSVHLASCLPSLLP